MKTIHDIKALGLLLLAAGLASCGSNEEPAAPVPAEGESQIVLRLTVSDTAAESRAPSTPEGGYDRGQGFENYIDISSLNFRFYFFDKENKFVAPLEVADVLPLESSESSKTYIVHSFAQREAITKEVKVKIVALANWPSYASDAALSPGVTSIDDIAGIEYDFNAAKMELSETNLIPLYGVTDLMTLSYDSNNTADIGTIHLLRAYAKVEVNIAPECAYAVESVSLTRHNTRGYCAPQGVYSRGEYIGGSYETDYTKTPSIPSGAETSAELPFMRTGELQWTAYVPEYKNIGRTDGERSAIKICFANIEPAENLLYFATYDTSTSPNQPKSHFDVMRNVYYKFNVNRLKHSFDINVTVIPYSGETLFPNFGFENDQVFIPQLDNSTMWNLMYDTSATLIGIYNSDYDLIYNTELKQKFTEPSFEDRYTMYYQKDSEKITIGYYDIRAAQFYDVSMTKIDYSPNGWQIYYKTDGSIQKMYDPIRKFTYQAEFEDMSHKGLISLYISPDHELGDNAILVGYYDVPNRQHYDPSLTAVTYDILTGYQEYKDSAGNITGYRDPLTGEYYDGNGTKLSN